MFEWGMQHDESKAVVQTYRRVVSIMTLQWIVGDFCLMLQSLQKATEHKQTYVLR